jgi:hypothetical protein
LEATRELSELADRNPSAPEGEPKVAEIAGFEIAKWRDLSSRSRAFSQLRHSLNSTAELMARRQVSASEPAAAQ